MCTEVLRFFHNVWVKRVLVFLGILLVFILGVWFADRPRLYSYQTGSSSYSSYPQSESYDGSNTKSFMADSTAVGDDEDLSSETPSKVIKTGALSITVKSTADTVSAMTALATSYGGFVQSSNQWVQSDDTTAATVTIRVDSASFEDAVTALKGLATVVRSETVSGQDVTEEYVDLQSRVKNLQAEEAQYLTILEKATTVEDLLKVSDYLSRVRGEIEEIQGRLKYLNNRTDYATITVSVYEEASVVVPTSDWQPFVVLKQAFNRLVETVQSGVNGFIWILVFGVPCFVFVWVVRSVWRFFHRNKR